ncbi:MAG TPA: metallophosphoesterase [Polyangiaceae bacterium]|nr:metallophosphoesterase [Polyangiaceae bacterium]
MGSSEAARKGRTVIVGDVHGCREELEALLEALHFISHVDRLVFVGDLVARGPDSRGVLGLMERHGARAVRGNHEARLLEGRADAGLVSGEYRRLAEALCEREWRLLEGMPLWIDLPEHGLRVVHAGVVPGRAIETTPTNALLRIRAIEPGGEWTDDKHAPVLWGTLYQGPPHVVFGHNALTDPQLHPWATGIDTGCVYGGRLTALVLAAREPVPRGHAVLAKLASVPARRVYRAIGEKKEASS